MSLTQINKAGLDEIALDYVFTIGASGTDHYTFQGEGLNGTVNDPTLYLTRGRTYRFENGTGSHAIRIQSADDGINGTLYNTGVTNNNSTGTVIVEVQHDAPDVLYYQCASHANMKGTIYITGALADGGVTTVKIADDAVNADKLANSINSAIAANTAKVSNATHTGDVTGSTSLTIAADAVDGTKIADDAIGNEHIASNAVNADSIAADAVGSSEIAANAVGASELADDAVDTNAIQNDAVTGAKIPNDAITMQHILADNVTSSEIAANAVSSAKIATGAVIAGKIAADAVTTTTIADDAVTTDKLADSINTAIAANTAKDLTALSASNLTSGTIPDARFPSTLPAVSGANLTGLGGGVPTGCILLWSGAENAIPSGYVLCNGSNSTPDLRNRFVVGAGDSYSVGNTGGADSVTLSVNQIPSHSHNITVKFTYGNTRNYVGYGTNTNNAGNTSTANAGGGGSHENRPPYYALCYIMKT